MAVKLADAVAYLSTDDSQLKKGMQDSEKAIESGGSRFGSVLQGIGMSVGLGIAGIAADALGKVTAFLGDSVAAASDMGETVSKTSVVFGESSAAVLAWAETAALAMGQSEQGALAAASTFGNLFVSMGMTSESSSDMSMNLVELASDLASFNNMSPEEVLEKLKAGLLGSAEPMQSLGVNMNAAMVEAKALEMGLAASTDALTPAMLAQARYAIILEQTTTAQGDFTRTSDGLANQQRILDAQMQDLQATVGEALLPIMLTMTSLFNDLVQTVLPPMSAFIKNSIVPAIEDFVEVISSLIKYFQAVLEDGDYLNDWLTHLPEPMQGVVQFIAQYLIPGFQSISAFFTQQLGPAIEDAKGFFTSLGSTMQGQADGPMAYLVSWFEQNMPRIMQIVQTVLTSIQQFWDQHGAQIMAGVQVLLQWLVMFWDTQMRTILDIVTAILQVLTGDFEGAGETLRGIVMRWWEFFQAAFYAIRETILSVDWGAIGEAVVDGIWDGMRNAWGGLEDWFNDRLQEMRNMLPFSEPKDPSSPLRGLSKSGEAIVEMIQAGMSQAADWSLPALQGPAVAGAGAAAGNAINITINVNGAGAGVGTAARDGVLSALRSAGLR